MKKFLAPTFAVALAAGAAAGIGAANAGEPVTLTAVQMDQITAGHNVYHDVRDHGDKNKKDRHGGKKDHKDVKKVERDHGGKKDHSDKIKKAFFKKHDFDFKKHDFDFKKHDFDFKKHAHR
jgi:hypothetical protein